MTFETDRVEINQELHLADALIFDTAEKINNETKFRNRC